MNTISAYNNNKTSFGAFNQPPKPVINHFAEVIRQLTPDNRKVFVTEMDKLVKSAESCPVTIEHTITNAYTDYYTPVVRGKHIISDKQHKNPANYILDVMARAVNYAKDVADADANIAAVKKIFNIQ